MAYTVQHTTVPTLYTLSGILTGQIRRISPEVGTFSHEAFRPFF